MNHLDYWKARLIDLALFVLFMGSLSARMGGPCRWPRFAFLFGLVWSFWRIGLHAITRGVGGTRV